MPTVRSLCKWYKGVNRSR